MVVLAVACIPALALLLALVLLADAHARPVRDALPAASDAAAATAMPAREHLREEDRIRPGVDAHGDKTWIDVDPAASTDPHEIDGADADLVWHEILPWPDRASLSRLPGAAADHGIRRAG